MKRKSSVEYILTVVAIGMAMMADAATIRVTEGVWYLGNKVTATNFLVDGAASLSGNGEVRAPVILAGTVSPGSSAEDIGTLSFSDTLAFDSGVFACYAATDTSLDLVSVTGNPGCYTSDAIARVRLLKTGEELALDNLTPMSRRFIIRVPEEKCDELDTVVAVEFKNKPKIEYAWIYREHGAQMVLPPESEII